MAFKMKGSPYPKKPSPVKHNLPGLRHTDPKKHGEYKQPHVHGTPDKGQGTDPTNEANPTKVKRKYYRQAKRKNSPGKFHEPNHVPREVKKEIKKEEKKDPKYVEKIKELENQYTRKQILDNEGRSQDKLRKLYEKLYPGEEYTP